MPDSYEEMSCDACMKSHDFLHLYKQRSNPVKISKEHCNSSSKLTNPTESQPTEVDMLESKSRNEESNKSTPETAANVAPSTDSVCGLSRRRSLLLSCSEAAASGEAADSSDSSGAAGFFGEGWRGQLCRCDDCRQLYAKSGVEFLLEESDPVGVYEDKAERRPTTHDAGMAALGSSLDRVQQVEAFHRKCWFMCVCFVSLGHL